MTSRPPPANPLNEHVGVVASIHTQAENKRDRHQRLVEVVTAELGHPCTIYILLILVLVWGLANAIVAGSGWAPWDAPPFHWLQGILGLYAAVVSTMVLVTQTRQQRHS
ncbi:MAG: hypothetical protein RJA70_4375, partial [Pseudomonadota bacterium]